MVSLVIAPLLEQEDWATWYYGLIPMALMIIACVVCYKLFWEGFDENTQEQNRQFDIARAAKEASAAGSEEMKVVGTDEAALSLLAQA